MTRPLAAAWLLFAAGCVTGTRSGAGPVGASQANEPTYVYVGGSGGEIAIFTLDRISGRLESRGTASGRAAALAADPAGRFLYAASDSGDLFAFAIRPRAGSLASLGRGSARGYGTNHLAVHRSGKYLFAANGGSSTVTVLPIKGDGRFHPAVVYPTGAGPQAVGAHPIGTSVFVLNGGARTVAQFAFNTGTGILTATREPPIGLPPRTVPRRIAFHPGGRYVYLLQEDGTIAGYNFHEHNGTLYAMAFQILSTVPPGSKTGKQRGGDVQVHPSGRFLYTVDRGHDEVNIYSLDAESGALALVRHQPSGGRQPRALAITEGKLGGVLVVAHGGSNNLTTFTIDSQNGALGAGATAPLRSSPASIVVVTPRD